MGSLRLYELGKLYNLSTHFQNVLQTPGVCSGTNPTQQYNSLLFNSMNHINWTIGYITISENVDYIGKKFNLL